MRELGTLTFAATLGLGVAVLVPSAATEGRGSPAIVRSGCPPQSVRLSSSLAASVDQVVAVARSQVIGQVTHDQGRVERRTRLNTPVTAVVMEIAHPDFSTLASARGLFRRVRRRCGLTVARISDAVVFHDGLSVIADTSITMFVVRTNAGWWVFGA